MWKKRQPRSTFKGTDSLIGQGGNFEGKVNSDTNLRIEGIFNGEIHCSGTVTVGEHGTVRSSITAEEVIIAGKVYGNISATRQIVMTSTGQLHGNIATGALSILEGGLLNGSVVMKEQPASLKAGGPETEPSGDKKDIRPAKPLSSREVG
ncbi:polymer-forming cytoskeletal protein [Paenibacillus sp. sgz500958]|uniref:bactofilin family protein n=1 Tax=Paenibacillus sp. sgz500958 TaxID=3242475 RepID=UPI0036D28565